MKISYPCKITLFNHLHVLDCLLMNGGIDSLDLVCFGAHPFLGYGLGHSRVHRPFTKTRDALTIKLVVGGQVVVSLDFGIRLQ